MESPPAPAGAGNDCFRYPFAPGSSISIDITGDRVELLSGTLIVDSVTPLVFGTIVLTQHRETTIEPGLVGTLVGDSILWTSPENGYMSWAMFPTTGTLQCDGPNCGLISMVEGEVVPLFPLFNVLSNTTPYPGLYLGQWLLNQAHNVILGSTTVVHTFSNVVELGNRRSGAFTFGPTQLGVGCPEPALSVVLVMGLGAVLARRRRMR